MRFGDKLEKLADARHLDRMKVFDLLRERGWKGGRATIHNYFSGKTRPDMDTALILARVLGVSLDYLADDGQDEPPAAVPGLTVEEYAVLSHFRVQREKEREAGRDLTPDDLAFRIAVPRLKNAGQTLIGTAGSAASLGNSTGSSNPRQEPSEAL